MFKYFNKRLNNFFSKEKFEDLLDSLAITNFSVSKGSYYLFWGIAAFTICFVVWASFASVDQVVRATGTVVPTSKVHTIQSPKNGVLEDIKVKMSDNVEKGDILFLIDHEMAKNKYQIAKSTRDAQQRKVGLIENLVDKGAEAEMVLIDQRLRLYESERIFQNASQELKFSKIKSPVKGIISSVKARNVDQVIKSGEEIATILPFGDILQVEASVNTKDIAYVIPGLRARLAFTAYDMSIYGQFDGIVTIVAPSTTKDSNDQPSYYKTIIEINTTNMEREKKISLQSGMMVDVSIIGEPRTVISYVINPITKLSKTALRD
jgi:multidrug efflux pump subunit AcrA (membrane-fusion protein)|tara:strand:+ start:1610 stop:2569 length:960 start_codon:yes stop_codon:yes gene_type:complete